MQCKRLCAVFLNGSVMEEWQIFKNRNRKFVNECRCLQWLRLRQKWLVFKEDFDLLPSLTPGVLYAVLNCFLFLCFPLNFITRVTHQRHEFTLYFVVIFLEFYIFHINFWYPTLCYFLLEKTYNHWPIYTFGSWFCHAFLSNLNQVLVLQ